MDNENYQMRQQPQPTAPRPHEEILNQMSPRGIAQQVKPPNQQQVTNPPEEYPLQMSPFREDRWELDLEENRRRKEIHRDYVYNYRKTVPPAPQTQPAAQPPAEPNPAAPSGAAEARPTLDPKYDKIDYSLIFTPKVEHKLEIPKPPNLFPVLKFPDRHARLKHSSRLGDDGFERERVCHYGVNVPFWQFSSKV